MSFSYPDSLVQNQNFLFQGHFIFLICFSNAFFHNCFCSPLLELLFLFISYPLSFSLHCIFALLWARLALGLPGLSCVITNLNFDSSNKLLWAVASLLATIHSSFFARGWYSPVPQHLGLVMWHVCWMMMNSWDSAVSEPHPRGEWASLAPRTLAQPFWRAFFRAAPAPSAWAPKENTGGRRLQLPCRGVHVIGPRNKSLWLGRHGGSWWGGGLQPHAWSMNSCLPNVHSCR